MSLEKLKQAKQLESKIIDQQEMLHFFEMGRISSISVRKFSEQDCSYEENDFSERIPRSILKTAMIEYLKKDIEHKEAKLNKLFEGEKSPPPPKGE